MGSVIAELLPFALAIVASAAAIIALVILLMGESGKASGTAFCSGWFLGVMAVMAIAILFGLAAPEESPNWALWTKVVLGVLLLVLAVKKFGDARRDATEEHQQPRWMAGLSEMSPGRAFVLGALLAGANPKNLLLALAAGSVIVASTLSQPEAWTTAAIFALVSSIGLLIPFGIYLALGARAQAPLSALRAWMERNTDGITITILVIFGVKLLADGIAGLA